MIWAFVAIYVAVFLVWLDVRRIQRREAAGPLHKADIIASSRPNGHVDIVGGGYRVP